jgi:hypothetical protein
VPDCTTRTIMPVSSAAVLGFIAVFHSFGSDSTITFPSGATMRSTRVGSMTTPRFATAAAMSAIWSGVTCSRSWPKARRPGSTAFGSFGLKSRPLL